MRLEDYESILDSLPSTGIYVIREEDHRILYFNSCIREKMPRVDLGMVCHEVWTGSCKNCPLLYIGDQKESKSINYDNPFGEAVDITAVRTMWGDKIPAFVITITPHIEVANYTFHKIIRGNLTDNSYEVVKPEPGEYEDIEERPETLSGYLKWFAKSNLLMEADRKRFEGFSDIDYLRRELKEGKEMVSCSYRKHIGESYRWYTLEFIPDYQYTDSRQSVMIYTKDVHDVYREGLERQEISIQDQERLAAVVRSRYGVMSTIHLDTGLCDRVYLDRAGQSDHVVSGDYEYYIQKAAGSMIYEADRERFLNAFALEQLRRRAQTVRKSREEVCEYRIRGSSVRWIEDHIFFLRQKDQVIVNILGRDVTEEKFQKEKSSMEQKNRALIISSMSSLFFTACYVDLKDNTFQTVSQYKDIGEVLGSRRNYAEGICAYASKFVHPDDREGYLNTFGYQRLMEELTVEHPVMVMEYRKVNGGYDYVKEGWVRATVILADEEEGGARTALYVAQDVTDSKRKEEQSHQILKDAYEAAKLANASKSDFLSRMSHDIRTPLNAIIGMTIIAGSHLDDSERVRDCLNKITVSGRHLLSLVNEVLDMSKIESGKISLSEESFHLSDLLQNLLTIIRPAAKEKKQELSLQVMEVKHEYVIGDQMQLQQVFVNILGNSVKYTLPGGKIEMKITEKPCREHGYGCYEFIFRDNGIGMDEEFVRRIFEPFSRAEDSRVSKIEGTGLGMAIAQNIVQMMNGTIQVKSEKGRGSQFTVTLYLKHQNPAERENGTETGIKSSADLTAQDRISDLSFEGYRVLLAEDNELNREIAEELIGETGVELETVENGEEALRMYQTHKAGYYDLIFMDIQMPVMNGYEATRAIRSSRQEDAGTIPVVAMTANAFAEDVAESQKAGMNEHVSKPLDPELLRECMARWLRDRK